MTTQAQWDIQTEVGGERVVLTPERGLYLPEHGVLVVADTHWGKAVGMRRAGIAVPSGTGAEQRSRLLSLIERVGAARVVVLGDLVHSAPGVTERVRDEACGWVESVRGLGAVVELVEGNHDRKLGARLDGFLESCGIAWLGTRAEVGGLTLVHEPEDADGAGYTLCGHVHPAVVLKGMGDAVKLPAFVLGERVGVLPAFSSFVSGVAVAAEESDRVFACAGDRVVAV
ncbi:MAG: ligase-associated DNA damage response endonuclease PdeM [Planctomycetota bacterium]